MAFVNLKLELYLYSIVSIDETIFVEYNLLELKISNSGKFTSC